MSFYLAVGLEWTVLYRYLHVIVYKPKRAALLKTEKEGKVLLLVFDLTDCIWALNMFLVIKYTRWVHVAAGCLIMLYKLS